MYLKQSPNSEVHDSLADDSKWSRRTIADAIDVLRTVPAFTNGPRPKIHVGPLSLPCGKIVSLIDVELPLGDDTYVNVSLPPSITFRAVSAYGSRAETFETTRLHEATVDGTGTVYLDDGSILRNVELVLEHLIEDPSDLDWQIIYALIQMSNAEDLCIVRLRDQAPATIRQRIPPDLRVFDFQAISRLEAPQLKVFAGYIADAKWILKKPSLQKIADTLELFGIRPVKPRPRRRFTRKP